MQFRSQPEDRVAHSREAERPMPEVSHAFRTPGVSPLKRCLGALDTVSWPWVPAWGSLEPSRRDGENAQKTGKNGEEMGEIRPKKCEPRELTKDQLEASITEEAGASPQPVHLKLTTSTLDLLRTRSASPDADTPDTPSSRGSDGSPRRRGRRSRSSPSIFCCASPRKARAPSAASAEEEPRPEVQ